MYEIISWVAFTGELFSLALLLLRAATKVWSILACIYELHNTLVISTPRLTHAD